MPVYFLKLFFVTLYAFLCSLKKPARAHFGYSQRSFTDQEQKVSEDKFKLPLHFVEVKERWEGRTLWRLGESTEGGGLGVSTEGQGVPWMTDFTWIPGIFGGWCSLAKAQQSGTT